MRGPSPPTPLPPAGEGRGLVPLAACPPVWGFTVEGSMYRAHGPSAEPGNSRISVRVHSGGLSQLLRSESSSLAAAAIASSCFFVGLGNGNVSKQVVEV